MRLCVKKIYCPNCRQAVRAEEEGINGQDRVTCSKCGRVIYIGNGVYWRRALPEGESRPGTETESASAGKARKTKRPKD